LIRVVDEIADERGSRPRQCIKSSLPAAALVSPVSRVGADKSLLASVGLNDLVWDDDLELLDALGFYVCLEDLDWQMPRDYAPRVPLVRA